MHQGRPVQLVSSRRRTALQRLLLTSSFLGSIHEHPDEARRPSGLAAPATPHVVSESEAESGAESSVQGESSSTVATSDHTPSVTSGSESKKNNFFPVTWRVVGGGVMMSGKRTLTLSPSCRRIVILTNTRAGEVCESFMAGHCPDGGDCRFAHPETSKSSSFAAAYQSH